MIKVKMIYEAAYKHALDTNERYGSGFFNTHTLVDSFIAGVVYALSNQWADVKDELPDNDDIVLVKTEIEESRLVNTTAYYKDGAWHFPDDFYYDVKVVAWMPILEMSKTENEKNEKTHFSIETQVVRNDRIGYKDRGIPRD